MADFTQSILQVNPKNLNSSTVQYNIYHAVYYSGDTYYHFKTNIPYQSSVMFMIEAIGYNYGSSQNIRSSWCGYTYSAGTVIYSIGLHNAYPGLSAHGMYYSSDGYVVIRANGESYFTGWAFNAYTTNPTMAGFQIRILATAQNTNAGVHF